MIMINKMIINYSTWMNWGPRQPDLAIGKKGCVRLKSTPSKEWKWYDVECESKYNSICKKQGTITISIYI